MFFVQLLPSGGIRIFANVLHTHLIGMFTIECYKHNNYVCKRGFTIIIIHTCTGVCTHFVLICTAGNYTVVPRNSLCRVAQLGLGTKGVNVIVMRGNFGIKSTQTLFFVVFFVTTLIGEKFQA